MKEIDKEGKMEIICIIGKKRRKLAEKEERKLNKTKKRMKRRTMKELSKEYQ